MGHNSCRCHATQEGVLHVSAFGLMSVRFEPFYILGWSVEIFLIGQFKRTRVKVFIFKKFQGAEILIFFDENWHAASFYNKEQMQKYKFEICIYHFTILYPWKSACLVFEENPPKKIFFVFWLWFSFKNNTDQNNICVFIVLKAKTEKKLRRKKLSFVIKTRKNVLHLFLLF